MAWLQIITVTRADGAVAMFTALRVLVSVVFGSTTNNGRRMLPTATTVAPAILFVRHWHQP